MGGTVGHKIGVSTNDIPQAYEGLEKDGGRVCLSKWFDLLNDASNRTVKGFIREFWFRNLMREMRNWRNKGKFAFFSFFA
jgi:hypothetical protein